MRFHTTIELNGKTATGSRVPAAVIARLGKGKRPPVRVTINGQTYRSTAAVYGEEFLIGVSAENRALVGVAAGDQVAVDLELDTEPRELTVPPDFTEALDRDVEARRFFDGLSYSNRQRFVLGIQDAKTPETRRRRIIAAVDRLREGRT
jgi:hypothetical protein